MKTTVLSMLVVAFSVASAPAAELDLDQEFPVVGQIMTVTVSGSGGAEDLDLWVVYSPNSETSTEEKIGGVPVLGEVPWTPARSGIATVSVRDASGQILAAENVAILFESTPSSGVMVMIFAGILLFGGAGFSMRSVLASGVPEHAPPIDT